MTHHVKLELYALRSMGDNRNVLRRNRAPYFHGDKSCALKHSKFANALGTIKASQVVVLNEDSVVVTQRKLM